MPPHISEENISKYQRYRARRVRQGMRLLRIWVPDPSAPGFREEAQRQAALLRGAEEESQALDFIAAGADLDDWTA